MRRLGVLVVGVFATRTAGAEVTIGLNGQGMTYAQQLGISTAELEDQIQAEIDDKYATANIDGFLKAFTNATSFSARGIGVDYASAPSHLLFGVAVSVAAAGEISD